MRYRKVIPGVFLQRPNRFIAYCEIDGNVEKCHVKNTGQCNQLHNRGRIPEWCCSVAEKA